MERAERTFQNYEEYLNFLKNKTTCDDPVYTANHERAHFMKAQDLGYTPLYGARFIGNDFPHIFIAGFIAFTGSKPVKEDHIKILLAPEKPGIHDLVLASRLRNGQD